MVQILQPAAIPAVRPRPNLLLHCGGQSVRREHVAEIGTPKPTKTWHPIAHLALVIQVERTLRGNGLTIGTQAHSLSHDGARYFGLMEIQQTGRPQDYCWVLGLRNSHDKTFPAGITAGAQVFVCDNLSFSGEVKLTRKHTRHINRDLPAVVQTAVGRLMERWHHQDRRIAAYKGEALDDRSAHDLVIRANDVGACTTRHIPHILREWREPRYEAFQPRSAWSLFNAFTEALKGNLADLPKRTERLHGLLDSHVALRS